MSTSEIADEISRQDSNLVQIKSSLKRQRLFKRFRIILGCSFYDYLKLFLHCSVHSSNGASVNQCAESRYVNKLTSYSDHMKANNLSYSTTSTVVTTTPVSTLKTLEVTTLAPAIPTTAAKTTQLLTTQTSASTEIYSTTKEHLATTSKSQTTEMQTTTTSEITTTLTKTSKATTSKTPSSAETTTTKAPLPTTSVLILSTTNRQNKPMITDLDGRVNEKFSFSIESGVEVQFSCSITFRGEFFIYGGKDKKKQIAKVEGCTLKDTGTKLSFKMEAGGCAVTFNDQIYLCFGEAEKISRIREEERQTCHKSGSPMEGFSKISDSFHPHGFTRIAASESKLQCTLKSSNHF